MPLSIITKVAIADHSPRGCCFEISTSLPNGRKFEFRAPNRIVCEQWVDRLNSAAVYFGKLPHFDERAMVPLSTTTKDEEEVAVLPKIKTMSTMSKTVADDAPASSQQIPTAHSSSDDESGIGAPPPSDSEISLAW